MILVIRKCAETRTYTGGDTYCALLSCFLERKSRLWPALLLYFRKKVRVVMQNLGNFFNKSASVSSLNVMFFVGKAGYRFPVVGLMF